MPVKITTEGTTRPFSCRTSQHGFLALLSVMLLASLSITTARADDFSAKCKDDANKYVARQFADSPDSARSATHIAHYNKRLGLCLVSVTLTPKLSAGMSERAKEVLSRDVMKALISVSDSRELAHNWSINPNGPPLGCRIQSSQMQNENCSSLAEYEAFVEKFMRE